MDVNRLLLILIMSATTFLGLFVYLKDKRNPVNISFNILTISIVLWAFSVFMILTVWKKSNPYMWVRTAYSLGTFMSTSFAIFAVIFHHGKFQPAKKYIAIFVPICIIMGLVTMTDYSVNIEFGEGGKLKASYGIGAKIWGLYEAICWAFIAYNLGKKWKNGSRIERLKLQYMFFGIVLTTTFMGLTNIILPFTGYEKAIGYGPVSAIIMIGCIAYAIVKHRLMDIRIFIRQGIVYSTLLAIASLILALLILGIKYAFPDIGKIQAFVVSILSGTFIVFIIRPLSKNIKELTNAFIFKDQYPIQLIISDYASSVVKTLDVNKLIELTFNTIVDALKVEKASIWILDEKTKLYNLIYSRGIKSNEMITSISSDSPIISHFEQTREPIVKEELEKILDHDLYDKIENDFKILGAEISIPLHIEEQLLGFLNLSSKSSGIYFDEDIAFINAIIGQAKIAIQNAMLHQQVVNMEKLSLLGRLSAELAHEIKNPLVTIKTALEFLIECQKNSDGERVINDDFKGFANLAMRETERINTLLKQLMHLGRPSPPKLAWCDINQIMDDTIMILKRHISERGIELIDLRNSHPIEIYADRDRIQQVFVNICLNAIEAMKSGDKLSIEIMTKIDEVNNIIVKISDTGKGMAKEDLKHIFEPFYTKKITGTGLGLAIVDSFVREHNGSIDVESIEGVGTTFTLEFPQAYQRMEAINA